MYFTGIDIGSTGAKTAVIDEQGKLVSTFVLPTGWSSFDVIHRIERQLEVRGISVGNIRCVSTGYGREAVKFADKMVTEITCHARGAYVLFGEECMNIVDIGGQDTKVISCCNGRVEEFFMNDKCSAGTGKFLEIMANRLQLPLEKLDEVAEKRTEMLTISSMCTVFAESEIVALIGKGTSKENISWGVLNSVVRKVRQEYSKLSDGNRVVHLTGGLCENRYFMDMLTQNFGHPVTSCPQARYAGAIGAAWIAASLK